MARWIISSSAARPYRQRHVVRAEEGIGREVVDACRRAGSSAPPARPSAGKQEAHRRGQRLRPGRRTAACTSGTSCRTRRSRSPARAGSSPWASVNHGSVTVPKPASCESTRGFRFETTMPSAGWLPLNSICVASVASAGTLAMFTDTVASPITISRQKIALPYDGEGRHRHGGVDRQRRLQVVLSAVVLDRALDLARRGGVRRHERGIAVAVVEHEGCCPRA